MKNDKLSHFEDFNHASHLKNKEKELCLSPNAEEFKIKVKFCWKVYRQIRIQNLKLFKKDFEEATADVL